MAERLSGEVADKFGGAINAASLARYVERVAEVMEQQKALAEDIAAICGEADEAGVASKRELRRLARESLMEPDVLSEQLARMADLRAALGSYAATPLGAAALAVRPAPPPGPPPASRSHAPKPAKAFAEQPLGKPRGRPRKAARDALADARLHLGDDAAGNA